MKKYRIAFLLLWVAFSLAAIRVHLNFPPDHFRNELWCDKGGYNVYLPATFLYHFDPAAFPTGIDRISGGGFILDTLHQKVYTKYTYGTALLQSPFWLGAHLFAADKTGYAPPYEMAVDVAAAFYLTAGTWLLFLIFCTGMRRWKAFAGALFTIAATNVLYYGVYEPGMSHIYSFFSISLLVYALLRAQAETGTIRHKWLALLALAVILSIIIRPLNIIIWGPVLLLANINDGPQLKQRLAMLFNLRFILPLLISLLLLVTPQVIYNLYLKGTPLIDNYEFETFSYVHAPRIAELLLSPNNGWLLWTPLALLIPVSIFAFLRKQPWTSLMFLLIITADVAIYSTWWSVDLGCGFGHRPFVEMIPALALPVAGLFRHPGKWRMPLLIAGALLLAVNLKLMLSFSGCFGGTSYWDWPYFLGLLF